MNASNGIRIRDVSRIVNSVVMRYQPLCPWILREDLQQEAWVGILGANNFDNTKGTFKNYYFRAAANCVLKFIIKNRTPFALYEMIDIHTEPYLEIPDTGRSPEELLAYKQLLNILYNYIIKQCRTSPKEARYALLVLAGIYKPWEAAQAMSISTARIYRITKRVRHLIYKEVTNDKIKIKKTEIEIIRLRSLTCENESIRV